jgi:hypothetical protein
LEEEALYFDDELFDFGSHPRLVVFGFYHAERLVEVLGVVEGLIEGLVCSLGVVKGEVDVREGDGCLPVYTSDFCYGVSYFARSYLDFGCWRFGELVCMLIWAGEDCEMVGLPDRRQSRAVIAAGSVGEYYV